MTARTDEHRPSAFDPKDYRAVGFVDCGKAGRPSWSWAIGKELPAQDAKVVLEEIELVPQFAREKLREFWPDLRVPGTNTGRTDRCAHCGAAIVQIVVVEHVPTGTLVPVGVVCAERANMPNLDALHLHSNSNKRKKLQVALLEVTLRQLYPEQARLIDTHFSGVLDAGADPVNMIRAVGSWLPGIRHDAMAIAVKLDEKDTTWSQDARYHASQTKRDGWIGEWRAKRLVEEARNRDFRIARQHQLAQDGTPEIQQGNFKVRGKVIRTKLQTGSTWTRRGPGQPAFRPQWIKLTIESAKGNRFYVTAPPEAKALINGNIQDHDKLKGITLTFVADLEPDPNDLHFAFAKNVTQVVVG